MCICVFTNKTTFRTKQIRIRRCAKEKTFAETKNGDLFICVFVYSPTKSQPNSTTLLWSHNKFQDFAKIKCRRLYHQPWAGNHTLKHAKATWMPKRCSPARHFVAVFWSCNASVNQGARQERSAIVSGKCPGKSECFIFMEQGIYS